MKRFMIFFALMGMVLQAGCGTAFIAEETTPPFRSSVNCAIMSQTVNPEAGSDDPVVGMDGVYGSKVMTNYQAGPKKKESGGSGSTAVIMEK